jgi:hypothetical protein
MIMGRALAISAIFLMAACSEADTHEIDREAWRIDLAALGIIYDNAEMARAEALHINPGGVCTDSDVEFGLHVEDRLDFGITPEELLTNIRHACPDKLEALASAFARLGIHQP